MANNSLHSPIPFGAEEEYNRIHNATELPDYTDFVDKMPPYDVTVVIILVCIILLSIFGLLGNGTVIWFLGFCMKRAVFATYILNLAVADLGVLLGLVPWRIIVFLDHFHPQLVNLQVYYLAICCFFSMNLIGQFLLTAISIDSCVSAAFPVWHRCRRPPNLSIIVCAVLWSLAFLITLVQILNATVIFGVDFVWYQLLVSAVFCLSLMTVSTIILFIKVCLRSQQRQQGNVLIAILMVLLFSLLFASPFTFHYLIFSSPDLPFPNALLTGVFCCCLNSSIKPLIYFLVGRRKRGQSRESMKVILQRLFKEEEDCREEVEVPIQTQV
ncbi:mas-related G-protein coupled receptor member X3-like [Lacerta agilis]|uniref:mas-related G-protein coupled receptor member X3-like n=1 Tax=Lacerta agilis TaxID=80427 RepID=UPI0014197A7F|nr:mas-related G-protein coupled receptor member X3-like [Lacerta agilis]XP_033009954.1 mas-related G-protein coupled receptor member X3-like [Lacerta agilis]XP_033009955.1 mas-related G-protein coupled receptor member X3-like [Lacerta agilis]XP_033009956.1 mas-related G-protein coupled receptor member X3-like [Lacerta agilis]